MSARPLYTPDGNGLRGTILSSDLPGSTDGFADRRTLEEARVQRTIYDGNKAEAPADAGKELYSPYSAVTSAINSRLPDLFVEAGAGEGEQEAVRATFQRIADTTHLPERLVAHIATQYLNGRIGDARIHDDPLAVEIAHDKQDAAWKTESRAALAATYGEEDGKDMLERMQTFVRAHPALSKILGQYGLGSRPDIVLELAAHVFSNGIR